MPRTDWERLKRHLQGLNLQPGQSVTLTAVQLKQILGLADLPPFTSRVTAWDPVMGKAGGVQRVLKELKMFPVAFEWSGSHTSRPILASITLVKWGAV